MSGLNINEVRLGGRVARQPVMLQTIDKNLPYCSVLIAINKRDTPDFIEVTAFDNLSSDIMNFCKVGTEIFVTGEVRYHKKTEKLKIKAKTIQFVTKVRSDNGKD